MTHQQTVNIELGEKEWEGVYSNFVLISHSPAEFIIDFARMLPGAKRAKIFSRILMTPQHAKSLLATLENNIKQYENTHGKIAAIAHDVGKASIGFQGVDTPDSPPKKD